MIYIFYFKLLSYKKLDFSILRLLQSHIMDILISVNRIGIKLLKILLLQLIIKYLYMQISQINYQPNQKTIKTNHNNHKNNNYNNNNNNNNKINNIINNNKHNNNKMIQINLKLEIYKLLNNLLINIFHLNISGHLLIIKMLSTLFLCFLKYHLVYIQCKLDYYYHIILNSHQVIDILIYNLYANLNNYQHICSNMSRKY